MTKERGDISFRPLRWNIKACIGHVAVRVSLGLGHKQEKLHLFFSMGGEELRPNNFQGEQFKLLPLPF